MAGASPILTVPVDDAAFKRFLDTFKKYQATLKEQPEMWKSMAGGVDGVAVAAAVMTEEVIRQTEATKKLTTEEEKREKLAQDAARRRKKDEDEQDRREKKAHDARKRQIDQVREYGRTVSNTVSGFGKWAAGGGGVMGVAGAASEGALGLAGLGAVGAALAGPLAALAAGVGATYLANSSLANSYRSAKGYGTSMGKLQGYQNQLQYDFDVEGAFGKMAAMQNDPTALSTFGMMGINPKGKDTADLVKEAALSARRMWIADQKNPMLAKAHGYGNVFSIPELNTLSANSPAELAKKFAAGDIFAKKNGLTDDQGKEAQKLMVAMGNLTDKIKNGLIAELIKLDPVLERVTNDFSKLADIIEPLLGKDIVAPGADDWQSSWDKFYADGGWSNYFFGSGKKGGAGARSGGGTGSGPGVASGSAKGVLFPNSLGVPYAGGWPSSGGGTGAGAGNGSLADQNNNPGNIRSASGVFRKFATPEAGWAAMRRQLLIDYDRYGQHSIRSIINDPGHGWSNEWAKGNTHESTANYISSVARQLGVGADDELNLHDMKMLQRLATAMNHVERGTGSGSRKAKSHRSQVHVKVSNQTGANVATTVHSAAG